MMADPAVQLLWDLVAAHMRADKNATMSKLASKLKPMRVVDWFNDESVRDQEVRARRVRACVLLDWGYCPASSSTTTTVLNVCVLPSFAAGCHDFGGAAHA